MPSNSLLVQFCLSACLALMGVQGFRLALPTKGQQIQRPATVRRPMRHTALRMAVYSSKQGVPAALVEERDACGVGFVASLNQEASHDIVKQALNACECMEHRGASSADMISGDGAGIMTAIPWEMFASIIDPKAVLNKDGSIASAAGMMFLPKADDQFKIAVDRIEEILQENNFVVKGWRDVPVDNTVLGRLSAEFVPCIKQLLFQSSPDSVNDNQKDFEKRLYDTRRQIQGFFRKMDNKEAYTCSFSSKTIVYKGMLRSCDLPKFFLDLTNPEFKTPFAVYHRRFSTNTVPKWYLAQPMRLLAHNGEINTLLGNINWVKSRQFGIRKRLEEQDFSVLAGRGPVQDFLETRQVRGPLVDVGRSDSANLDSIFENFVRSGFTAEEALMVLVPEAFESQPRLMSEENAVKSFYQYYESVQEAWDGPALLVFSDGEIVGATLDRNGLRPARYMLTADANDKLMVHVMSEVGVTKIIDQFSAENPVKPSGVRLLESGRLGPGEMLSVHLSEGKFYLNDALKESVAARRPYKQWFLNSVQELKPAKFEKDIKLFIEKFVPDATLRQQSESNAASETSAPVALDIDNKNLITTQSFYGWGTEDVEVQITAMASSGMEATYSMGDDAPLAALSAMPHTLFDYFKQRFAQVTNPPIDPLREGAVMSLAMFIGPRGDPLSLEGQGTKRVKIPSPVLNAAEFDELHQSEGLKFTTLSTLYPLKEAVTVGGLKERIDALCDAAVAAINSGANVINLSDKVDDAPAGTTMVGSSYIPPLLAVASVHHRLIREGLRPDTSIVVTTGQAWVTHHFACLVGFGASAVVPYAAYDAVLNWHGQKRNQNAMERGDIPKLSVEAALKNYRKSVDKGLLKILSKMGISLLTSYQGAQIFESLGIADDVLMDSFRGTPSRVGGLTYDDIAAECAEFSRITFGDEIFQNMVQQVEQDGQDIGATKLFNYGFLNYLKSGDYHHNNQPLIKTLHGAIRTKDIDLYNMYEQAVTSRPPTTFRDAMQFKSDREPVPLESVESVESIMKRFCTGGMSLGALSREAHETLAIAVNRIGGRSNSGEGGEDPVRMLPIEDVDESGLSASFPHLKGLKKGDKATSRIKQVASGRFGVTPQYLMSADQLEIKIAQGAKPGEGGQLPGKKIDSYIATLRSSKPGVTLISPPPHHDIYSIEDLAQLIYDLHQINPVAGVSVKLVSEVGIGTVASGVAKAGADIIQISGHDGGTGASPASSIKHAGSPWELGLSETHATLRRNGLRDRVLLRVDGGLKSGWDVVMAAAMGAEEYGFGTIALIAEGCIMARICHTNKCPVGVTTQNAELRKRFPGTPEDVVTFFTYVAEEVRQILAKLGYKSLDDIIGLPGLLHPRENLKLKKTSSIDISYVMSALYCTPEEGENLCDVDQDRSWLKHGEVNSNGRTFDDIVLEDADVIHAIESQKSVRKQYRISNIDRASFSRVSGVIAKKYGDKAFQGRLQFDLTGASGQSFCAFIGQGMEVTLAGYANDYVGKGMAGGKITVKPPLSDLPLTESSNVLRKKALAGEIDEQPQFSVVGNTVLYGATAGKLFVNGRAGERFAVRNSGALGIVQGMGDHGCEYMTGGVIINLGTIGRNFAAGMTGGVAFVVTDAAWLDQRPQSTPAQVFEDFINPESLGNIKKITSSNKAALQYLNDALSEFIDETDSNRAKFLLQNLNEAVALGKIIAIAPPSESDNPIIAEVLTESKIAMTSNNSTVPIN